MNNYYQHSAPCYSFGKKLKNNFKENEVGPGQYNWTTGKDKTMRSQARTIFPRAKNTDRFGLKTSDM
jgi:hypothetical protein